MFKYKGHASNIFKLQVIQEVYKHENYNEFKYITTKFTLVLKCRSFKWTTMLNDLYRSLQDNIMHMNKSYLRRSSKWENKQLELTCLWSSLISHVYSHTCYTRITEKKRTKQNNMNNLKKSKFQNGYNNLHK